MDDADNPLRLPPPAVVQAVLRTATERLATELAAPSANAPHWSELEWRAARAAAAMHGISGMLAVRLRWLGPPGWQDFVHTQRQHIARRHTRIERLLSLLDAELRSRDIPGVALKGAALHAHGIYAPGDRPMGDVDLLVQARHGSAAARVLDSLGFRESDPTVKHRTFVARCETPSAHFGEHTDNDLKIDLHERIVEALPLRLVEISQRVFPHEGRGGLNPYPTQTALLAHLLLHAAGAMVDRSLRLIQLHDIALLGRRVTETDWQELLAWEPWWALPPLALAERCYGSIAPPTALPALRKYCPPLLRRASGRNRVSEVSLSQVWVAAFPGLAWARSPGEMLRYVGGRLVPDAQVRLERQQQRATEPSLGEGDWAGLSQAHRMLRFLTSRPHRPWPMYNMRAALAQRP
jgi:hypothetical protein